MLQFPIAQPHAEAPSPSRIARRERWLLLALAVLIALGGLITP